MPTKINIVCASHIPYLVLQEDNTYYLPYKYYPIDTAFKETDCLSKSS